MFRRKGRNNRLGGAVVEMAVVAPLLCTLVFGVIEYGWVFSVRQALTNAAREGARTAALAGSTNDQINARVNSFLSPYHLSGLTITITHSSAGNPNEVVAVSVPYANVTLLSSFFGRTNFNLGWTCSMRKEGMD